MENRNQRNNKKYYVPKVVEESKIVNEFNTSKDDEVVGVLEMFRWIWILKRIKLSNLQMKMYMYHHLK